MIGFWWAGGNYLRKASSNCLILLQLYQKKNPQLLGANSTGKCRGFQENTWTAKFSLGALCCVGNLVHGDELVKGIAQLDDLIAG